MYTTTHRPLIDRRPKKYVLKKVIERKLEKLFLKTQEKTPLLSKQTQTEEEQALHQITSGGHQTMGHEASPERGFTPFLTPFFDDDSVVEVYQN